MNNIPKSQKAEDSPRSSRLSRQVLRKHLPKIDAMREQRSLTIGSVSQAALDDIFMNCRQLEVLVLCDIIGPVTVYDIRNIGNCKMLKALLLPMEIKNPVAICSLTNLTHLTFQRQDVWPEMDWLSTVKDIVYAKRYDLQAFSFDGSRQVSPVNLHQLQLAKCTALTDLRLTNCKLTDVADPPFPYSCQRICFRQCSMVNLHNLIKNHSLLVKLELLDCQVLSEGPLLAPILNIRRLLPVFSQLFLTFTKSTRLRSECTKWTQNDVKAFSKWLQIQELSPQQAGICKQAPGSVSMKFTRSINYMPNLQLPEESIPSAADIVKDL
ncbi:uncharacterized protein LOC108114924 [Drosophila eugracilis]|uniref:uncharacterized protein LOC108114924 n=1 Tax=Drosophila eugracilis TaxID=29029 RepID=UPI0007E81C95|nr:uncharacterized protein LOC108114924 [Drosophila eugracilis]